MRADSAGRASFYISGLTHGWINRNEVRRLENLPPIPGGELFTVQAAMVSLESLERAANKSEESA